MRAGRDRPRDRLRLDVALIREREPCLPERVAELADARARQGGHEPALGVDARSRRACGRMSSTVPVVSISGVNEWPAPSGRMREPPAIAARTCVDDLVLARRGRDLRVERLVADPVPPGRAVAAGAAGCSSRLRDHDRQRLADDRRRPRRVARGTANGPSRCG